MNQQTKSNDLVQSYARTLREVSDVIESCGCSIEVTSPTPSEAVLMIKGCISFCPASIFEEHVEKAKELMRISHPEARFRVEVIEAGAS